MSLERRIAGGAAVGAHKTSMLQDLELGRPMEIDALVAVVHVAAAAIWAGGVYPWLFFLWHLYASPFSIHFA